MMNIFRIFGIGSETILKKNCYVPGFVTMVSDSHIYVIKKPVRLYPDSTNTKYSHIITFRYVVDNVPYTGKLFVSPHYRCPQKGETIHVYYDPNKPERYACYAFGPGVPLSGW